MIRHVSRRRVLQLVAATSGFGLASAIGATIGRRSADGLALHRWNGTALGAEASLLVHHPDAREAARLVALARAEIERLEAIFSLHRRDSALARLNGSGFLDTPPPELVELLERAVSWSRASTGAFDVTVQPLWALYRDHFARSGADPSGPNEAAVAAARGSVDYRALEISSERIRFTQPGMAVTLNGIAQGDITDRVTELLRAQGLQRTLVNLGEFRALGGHPAGRPWQIGIKDPNNAAALIGEVDLTDRALATSAVTGTLFDEEGRHHHLFNPTSGRPSRRLVSASVIAPEARNADACSTALLAASHPLNLETMRSMDVDWAFTIDSSGATRTWNARA